MALEGNMTVHAVMEYADGEREPLCGDEFNPETDQYEDDDPDLYVSCDPCHQEMRSRGWDVRTPPDHGQQWILLQSEYAGLWVFACPHCGQTCDMEAGTVEKRGLQPCPKCKRYHSIPQQL